MPRPEGTVGTVRSRVKEKEVYFTPETLSVDGPKLNWYGMLSNLFHFCLYM